MKEKTSSKALNGLVIVGIILTIFALIGTPLGLTALLKTSRISNMVWILTAFIYACAVPYLIALFKFKRVCKLLTGENSFSPFISKDFQGIAICAFTEAFIYTLSNILLYVLFDFYLFAMTILPLIVVVFVAVTLGFLFLIMSSIFKRAAEIKEENDLIF